jgi:hypothetical protein
MANLQRTYTGGATPSALASAISASSPGSGGTLAITTSVGWPTGAPFALVIDRGTVNEEQVLCVSRSAELCIIAPGGRGHDGTVAKAHNSGAPVEHCFDAASAQAFVDHVNDKVEADVHPGLYRRAEHTLAEHEDLDLVSEREHTLAAHEAMGLAAADLAKLKALGVLNLADHRIEIHDGFGYMKLVEHTDGSHNVFNYMKRTELAKYNIDPLGIDAATVGGQTPTQLTKRMVASWESASASAVYTTNANTDMVLTDVPVIANHTYGIHVHAIIEWAQLTAAARWDLAVRWSGGTPEKRLGIMQPGVNGTTFWPFDAMVFWRPTTTYATDDITFRLNEVANGADVTLNGPRSISLIDWGVFP